MSGVVITASGVDASANNIGLVLPYATNCEAFGILGGTTARSQKNYALGKADFVLVGSPTISANSVQFLNNSKWLQTAVAESDNLTAIVVCSAAKQNCFYVSNSGTTRSGAPSIYPNGFQFKAADQGGSPTNNNLTSTIGYYDGTVSGAAGGIQTPTLTRVASAGYRCASARFDNSTQILKTNDLTAGDSSTVGSPTGVRDKLGMFRVGSSYLGNGGHADAADILGFAIYSEALSDENLALVYNWFKTYYARRGISI